MSILPDYMPKYEITPDERPPFPVVWEEMMGWFIVPKLREQISWAMYDAPGGRVSERVAMKVVGRAEVHGVEGVEIEAVQTDAATGREQPRRFIAQLTRTHCRALAESHREDGVNRLYTFLDGDAFLKNWGFGEDNCGNETHLSPKGKIARRGREITVPEGATLDAVDRCAVSICGKTYDTVRVMDVSAYCGEAIATEQFLDANGRTVLWRRFNRDDWQIERYGQRWTERLPDNERLTINGKTYVHWYDCITDGIM